MYKLKRADYPGNFHGFTLKEGYFYGIDDESGTYIATSGWEAYEKVAIYFLENGNWILRWIDIDDDFQIKNISGVSTEDKMSFVEWLEKEEGISWNDWDENYSGELEKQIEECYDKYYYNGLPRFVIINMD